MLTCFLIGLVFVYKVENKDQSVFGIMKDAILIGRKSVTGLLDSFKFGSIQYAKDQSIADKFDGTILES